MTVRQISVFLENRPGALHEFTQLLEAHNIDLRALSLAESEDFGIVRVIVDDPLRASQVLKDFKDKLDRFDKHLDDLDRVSVVALQSCPQIKILQNADKTVVDLAALDQQLAQAKALQDQSEALCGDLRSALENHGTVLDKVRSAKKKLAGTDSAYRRLARLAAAAVGVSAEGEAGLLNGSRTFRENFRSHRPRQNVQHCGADQGDVGKVIAGRKRSVRRDADAGCCLCVCHNRFPLRPGSRSS